MQRITNNQTSNHTLPYIATRACLVAVLVATVAIFILVQPSVGMIGKDPKLIAIFSVSGSLAVIASAITVVALLRLRASTPSIPTEQTPPPVTSALITTPSSDENVAQSPREFFDAEEERTTSEESTNDEFFDAEDEPAMLREIPNTEPAIASIPLTNIEDTPTSQTEVFSSLAHTPTITVNKTGQTLLNHEMFVDHMRYYTTLASCLFKKLLCIHKHNIFSDAHTTELIQQQQEACAQLLTKLNDSHFVAWLALDTLRAVSTPQSEYDPDQPEPTSQSMKQRSEYICNVLSTQPDRYKIPLLNAFKGRESLDLRNIASVIPKDNEELFKFLRTCAVENIKMHVSGLWLLILYTTFIEWEKEDTTTQILFQTAFNSAIQTVNLTRWTNLNNNYSELIRHPILGGAIRKLSSKHDTTVRRLKTSPLGQCYELPAKLILPPVFYVHLTHPDSSLHKAFQSTLEHYKESFKEMPVYQSEHWAYHNSYGALAQIRHFLLQDPESAEKLANFTVTENAS